MPIQAEALPFLPTWEDQSSICLQEREVGACTVPLDTLAGAQTGAAVPESILKAVPGPSALCADCSLGNCQGQGTHPLGLPSSPSLLASLSLYLRTLCLKRLS